MLQYNESLGSISDVLNYFTFYLNEDTIINERKRYTNDLENEISFYTEIKNSDIHISEKFKAFFYYDKKFEIFMTNIFYKNFLQYKIDSIENFFKFIGNIPELRKEFLKFFLFDMSDEEKELMLTAKNDFSVYSYFINSELPHDLIYQILYALNNFEEIIKNLITVINQIYPLICNLRKINKSAVQSVINKALSEEGTEILIKRQTENNFFPLDTSFSVELIKPWDFIMQKTFILIGLYSLDNGNNLYEHVNIATFSKMYDDTKSKILDMFLEKPEITSYEIRKVLDISQQVVHKHISKMREEGIIYISRKQVNEFCYSVNFLYFDAFIKSFEEYVRKMKKARSSP